MPEILTPEVHFLSKSYFRPKIIPLKCCKKVSLLLPPSLSLLPCTIPFFSLHSHSALIPQLPGTCTGAHSVPHNLFSWLPCTLALSHTPCPFFPVSLVPCALFPWPPCTCTHAFISNPLSPAFYGFANIKT